ncbi:MAG: hypothetical protein QOD75_2120 [Blastocatellia bacterium]|nr:hypothetical protein [Blastocatellia bacterium]
MAAKALGFVLRQRAFLYKQVQQGTEDDRERGELALYLWFAPWKEIELFLLVGHYSVVLCAYGAILCKNQPRCHLIGYLSVSRRSGQ